MCGKYLAETIFAYAQQGVRIFQRATQQGLEATEQVTRQGLRVAEEVLRQTEKASRKAELRTAVFGALKTANYDELTVDEISGRLEGLSTEELKKLREFEKQNKNRETLIERIDSKIRADS